MQIETTLAAEYYPGSRSRPAALDITRIIAGHRTPVFSTTVGNKREARQLASDFGAVAWNF